MVSKPASHRLLLIILLFGSVPAMAQVRLPRIVRDSMVLQRDATIRVWGWASPNENVTVKINGKMYKTKTAADSSWQVSIAPLKAGGPYTMKINGRNTLQITNILAGDVWVCSGQSNMVHQMKLHDVLYEKEIADAHYPQIRHFWIPTMTELRGPRNDLPAGNWKEANPTDVRDFSAVAYFFAKQLYDKYKIPIGLINASVGGTPIEAWTSEEGLKEFSAIQSTIAKNKDTAYVNEFSRAAALAGSIRPKPSDKGLTGSIPWYDLSYKPAGWRTITVPGYWEDQGIRDLNGVVWYRREIEIPESMAGKAARVFLGRIVDADALYINGTQVGNTGYQYPQRRYNVPANLLKAGKNLFVVRVVNNANKGGFVPDKPYYIFADGDTVDLKGDWHYKVGEVYEPKPAAPGFSAQSQPTALYNAMVAPLVNYTVKGFLWYQGEANAWRPQEYAYLQPAQIVDWRNKWKLGDLPFLYVQLPGFMDMNYLPAESQWAILRESQLSALSVSNTGMAVAIDLGEWNDIHPDNKKAVGDRLALLARKKVYGENIVAESPIMETATLDGNKIIISFNNAGAGLITSDNEEPRGFAIAADDKKFVWARAVISGNKITVWSDQVKNPKYVRYGWADYPDVNTYNKEGLPVSPFRTDR